MNSGLLASMYITLLPIIITGIVNAAFCHSSILGFLKVPIDGGKTYKDNRRIFGDNKTWKGFIGTIFWSMVLCVVFGLIYGQNEYLITHNFLYENYDNTVAYSAIMGALLGFAYAISELPNSFMKRRLDIKSGKQGMGLSGFLFAIYDQIDSLIWVVLVVALVYRMSISFYVCYVFVAGVTHVVLNCFLFGLKLRKNIL